MLSWVCMSMALPDLSILGNKYINTDFKYHTDPGAGIRNREEYARQFGFMGEHLVEELGKGHHSGDVANLPPQFSSQPQYSRNVRQKRRLRKTQGQVLLNLALS